MRLLPAVAAALAFITPSASAQIVQVVINEVNFTKGDQWIELYNATTADVKLGGWSIYQATRTKNRVNDYWWAFPAPTTIKAGDYLRIHWGAAIKTPTDKRNIYTGNTSWHFLFGHSFEAFDRAQGVIAICTTQDNKLVSTANVFSDWWQWGATGFKREGIAVSNKPTSLWNANAFIPVPPSGASLMRLDFLDKLPHPLNAFRQDFSPTPLLHNAQPIGIKSTGAPCGRKKVGVVLSANDYSYHGNKDFSLTVKNTQGAAYFERMLYVVNANGVTFKYGPLGFQCDVVDYIAPGFNTPFFATTANSTTTKVPLTVSGINGLTLHIQALVIGTIPVGYESFSNRLAITISQ